MYYCSHVDVVTWDTSLASIDPFPLTQDLRFRLTNSTDNRLVLCVGVSIQKRTGMYRRFLLFEVIARKLQCASHDAEELGLVVLKITGPP